MASLEVNKITSNFICFFIVSVLIYAIYLNYKLPSYAPLFFIALFCFGLSFLLYKKLFFALIITLIISEIFWTMLFWPFSTLTIAGVLLIIYYFIWQIHKSKKLKQNLALASGLIFLLILTSFL